MPNLKEFFPVYAVGYDNISYFHRIFYKKYGTTPRKFRMGEKIDNSSGLCYTQVKTNLDAVSPA